MFKLQVGYPAKAEERRILDLMATPRQTCVDAGRLDRSKSSPPAKS